MNKANTKISLQKKLVFIILPFIIMVLFLSLIISIVRIENVLKKNISKEMSLMSTSVTYQIEAEINQIIGIIDNVKTTINRHCKNSNDINNYLYSISGAFKNYIPNSIYCGLKNGTYIDTTWTPEPGWKFEERPWYISGLESENVIFSDMYIDAQTGKYCITATSRISDSSNNTIGVIAGDVFLDSIENTLSSKKIFDKGYVYAIDIASELIIGNTHNKSENGKKISELKDDVNKHIYEQIKKENFDKTFFYKDEYFSLCKLSNSNFIVICRDSKTDVEKNFTSIKSSIYVTTIVSIIFICLVVFVVIGILLRPVSKLNSFIGNLSNLDLVNQVDINTKDELGAIAN